MRHFCDASVPGEHRRNVVSTSLPQFRPPPNRPQVVFETHVRRGRPDLRAQSKRWGVRGRGRPDSSGRSPPVRRVISLARTRNGLMLRSRRRFPVHPLSALFDSGGWKRGKRGLSDEIRKWVLDRWSAKASQPLSPRLAQNLIVPRSATIKLVGK